MNRLTIIRKDGAVYIDDQVWLGLDLSFINNDIHALQWKNKSGWIEYTNDNPNQIIENLPEWALQCITIANSIILDTEPDIYPEPDILQQYKDALAYHFDEVAKQKDYNDAISIVSYANSTNESWKNQSLAFIAWRDSCWLVALQTLDEVQKGQRDAPSVEQFLNELPVINWP